VPSESTTLRIRTDWGNPAFDLDLFVYGPSGDLVASSAQGLSSSEQVAIPAPKAGNYKVTLKGYLNGPVSYTGKAERDYLKPLSIP
jgi:serine protease AprX